MDLAHRGLSFRELAWKAEADAGARGAADARSVAPRQPDGGAIEVNGTEGLLYEVLDRAQSERLPAGVPVGHVRSAQLLSAGQRDEARLVFEKMLTYANHLGLYAEEIGPTGEQLGNFPQAFTHLALISAAVNLDHQLG